MTDRGGLGDPCAWIRANGDTWRRLRPPLRKWARTYARNHCAHFRMLTKLIERLGIAPPARVVDVGAVPGHMSAFLADTGYDVTAVDLDPDRVAPAFESFSVTTRKADIEHEPIPAEDASVELVLLCQTLEHLRVDPLRPLRETRRILAPGGAAIVSVPQITPHMRWRFLRGEDLLSDPVRERRKVERIGHGGDARLYSRPQMERMLHDCGFDIADVVAGGGIRTRGKPTPLLRLLVRLRRARMQANLYFLVRPASEPA